jgi:hypothetical protein
LPGRHCLAGQTLRKAKKSNYAAVSDYKSVLGGRLYDGIGIIIEFYRN